VAQNGFTFYRSYYEAAQGLPDKQRLALYDSMLAYMMEDLKPNLSGASNAMFVLMKPTLDKSKTRSRVRRDSAEKESNGNQNDSVTSMSEECRVKSVEGRVKSDDAHVRDMRKILLRYEHFAGADYSTANVSGFRAYLEHMEADVIIAAIDDAAGRGQGGNYPYIQAILRDWKKAGITTMEAFGREQAAQEQERKDRRNSGKVTEESRNYDDDDDFLGKAGG